MGKAEAVEHIAVGLSEDMRHAGIVAHDLDLARQAGHGEAGVVIGQRARGEVIDDAKGQREQGDEQHKQTEGPLEHCRHWISHS